jgi:hypothetical protein
MDLYLHTDSLLYISYKFLNEKGINSRSIENWKRRNPLSVIKHQGAAFISFTAIPTPSKLKLPTEAELLALLKDHQKDSDVTKCYDKLKYAQINKASDYRAYYRDAFSLNSEEALKAAMKRAVWERLVELYKDNHSDGYSGGLKKGALDMLHKAYNRLYPDHYSSKHAFLRTINTVKSAGIDSIIVDKRKLNNGKNAKFNELHQFFVNGVSSIGKAYTASQIQAKIIPMCLEAGLMIPSVSWIKNHIAVTNKHNEYATRYGADKVAKTMPYASIQPALHADKQWQIDGWTLPFYYKNEQNRFDKLTIIAVKDAYSKKIVGYSINRSENRISIMDAFQDAIANTDCLPFEIVADNHSFNRTKEANNFITEIQKIGVTWTVTENPQHKNIVERGFKTFGEQFCKEHYGYKGQGVKTKDLNGLTSPEMLQQYIKAGQILSEAEIQLIGIEAVMSFNKTELKQYGKSPNQLYQDSEKPARFEISLYERLRILTKRSEYTIRRNQINITIAGKTYEYQLPANKYRDYNNKKVAVRYDTTELIYLLDLKTDEAICSLK